ncbi:hypothetical protein [uncultured Treponema sp.]|uniref:hypothetical protein n=1 Tax=Treponema sp. TaxID=166 RepID=UPI0025F6D3CB|nr:hypothetical protein [uncultured Treponema sp.]
MDCTSIFEKNGLFFKCSHLESDIFLSKFKNNDAFSFCKGLLEAGNDFIFEKTIYDINNYWDYNFIFGIKIKPESKIKAQFLLKYKKIKEKFFEGFWKYPGIEVQNCYSGTFSTILRYEIPKEEFSSEFAKINKVSNNINFAHTHFSFEPKSKMILVENVFLSYDLYELKLSEKLLCRNDEKQKKFFLQGNEIMPVLEKIQKLEFSNIE